MSAALHAKNQRQHHKRNHTYRLTKDLPVQYADAWIDNQSECTFNPEYKTEIADVANNCIVINGSDATDNFFRTAGLKQSYEIYIFVNNTMYVWKNIQVSAQKKNNENFYRICIDQNPEVFNRRKYPRLFINNSCRITLSSGTSYDGRMINICAGGFAFSCAAPEFADIVGKQLDVTIQGLDFLSHDILKCTVAMWLARWKNCLVPR